MWIQQSWGKRILSNSEDMTWWRNSYSLLLQMYMLLLLQCTCRKKLWKKQQKVGKKIVSNSEDMTWWRNSYKCSFNCCYKCTCWDGRTDVRTDGQNLRSKAICPPCYRIGGIKMCTFICWTCMPSMKSVSATVPKL